MGQIVKRRKKGRQSESDLLVTNSKSPAPESDYRRSLRRRYSRPIIDYDDYLDEYEEEMMLAEENEDEDEEDEDERISSKRRKKKLQSVVKLVNEFDSKLIRKRRGARRAVDDDDDDDYDADVPNDLDRENEDENEGGGLGGDSNGEESDPGTPVETRTVVPLPDKKLLELILDKLQKKDIYGVYAEPVDPEELPDYFDVIKHPMDFATVRKKLASGKYSNLDQIEKDVLLICSNAMQYNEPDTVYYKQARTIQEMAIKKFNRVRSDFERSELQINTEEKNKANHIRINPVKRVNCRNSQEPVGSGFQPVAALSTLGESQNGLNLPRVSSFAKPCSSDGLVEGNVSTMENDVDRVEESVSGKNVSYKLVKKPLVMDENRRSTYKLSNQLTMESDSIFTTFEKEPKELISVGLQAEYSYARSLARFAGTLGPVAWNIAAKNIKEALSQDVKFGRGWVGEYEPLSTPFLKVESQCNMRSDFPTALPNISHLNAKGNQKFGATGPFNFNCNSNKDHPTNEPVLEGRSSFTSFPDGHPTKRKPPSIVYDGRGLITTPISSINPGRNPFSKNRLNGGAKVGIQDVSFISTANPDNISFSTTVQLPKDSFVVPCHAKSQPPLKSAPFKKAECGGLISGVPTMNVSGSTFEKSRLAGISADNVSGPAVRSAVPSIHGQEHQGVSDPVHLMRMLAEKAQNQQNCMAHSPISPSPVTPAVQSSRRFDIINGPQISPRSWMSIGSNNVNKAASESPHPHRSHISAESLYNPARDNQQVSRFRGETPGSVGLHFQIEKNPLPNQTYGRENHWFANEAPLQGQTVNMTKLGTTDLSRFQLQSPRQSLNYWPQTRQTLPPDLNVGFQSSGSPARQGTQVDTQQPDLALQL